MVLLRKRFPQIVKLQTAAELGVRKYMNQYRNAFMGIEVNFPDTWKFRYWGNRPESSPALKTHQSNFDDLPSKSNPEKVMVSSISPHTPGKITWRGIFEMVALYRPNGVDLNLEVPIIESEMARNTGNQIVAGNHACFMQREMQCEGYIRYMRCYYWQFQAPIWFACIASGSSVEQFNEALGIIELVRKI